MITTYLDSDMNSDGIPLPNPSKAPEHVTETADTAKPQLMYLRAVTPIFIVSGFAVNNPISWYGITQASIVPSIIIDTVSFIAVLNILSTRLCSPAP